MRSPALIVKCAPMRAPGITPIDERDRERPVDVAEVPVRERARDREDADARERGRDRLLQRDADPRENAGTMRMPPPTPSRPESAPAATPMTARRHHSSSIGWPARSSVRERRERGAVAGVPDERRGQDHQRVAVAGHRARESGARDRRGNAERGGDHDHAADDHVLPAVAQRSRDRRRQDRRQRRADGLERGGAEGADRRASRRPRRRCRTCPTARRWRRRRAP